MSSGPSKNDERNPYRAPAAITEPPPAPEPTPEFVELRRRHLNRETTLRALAILKLWTVALGTGLALSGLPDWIRPELQDSARIALGAAAAFALLVAIRTWQFGVEVPYVQAALSLGAAAALVGLAYWCATHRASPDPGELLLIVVAAGLHSQIAFVAVRPATFRVCSPVYLEAMRATTGDHLVAAIVLKVFGWSVLWWITVGLIVGMLPSVAALV